MVQTEKTREQFSQRLAQACEQAGLNEHGRGAAIVRALGVSSKAVSKWFNSESLPRQEKMNALADYLKVDIVWLQHGIDNASDNARPDKIQAVKPATRQLTKEQEELLELFDRLPAEEADRFLKEMKIKAAHFDAIFAEMLAKRSSKAS
ncbi:helix-turn-helix domain-containing protein [Xenorhabdus sp. VLS]|uniref:Helix-turn-helix domain-containing protein n=1 Tax=Xenorhabdus lircayensis TaxID=2763499 RepID=A0ABS0U0I8_9GAMM|nr:helix-turn-helix domain-containing protein [Xenorhabdus lircayensis]